MENRESNRRHVVIIGGGLVGALCACYMAKRGFQVDVYEYRDDIRRMITAPGRSINLALSNRGRNALRHVGLEDKILEKSIPMKGRLLHSTDGKKQSILYDPRTNQCIHSVGRNYINEVLLTAIEKYPNAKIHFKHKLVSTSIEDGTVSFLKVSTKETIRVQADFIIGADGAYSALRRGFQHSCIFNYSQKYIEHGYMELRIPPSMGDLMIPNHLHIWPRGEFMMIALPNYDSSWTVTLFMSFERFRQLNTKQKLLSFFKDTFPDSLPLLGEEELVNTFFGSKPSPLIYIKCDPYNVGKKFLLVGDAAHAMVPFYGQGMNSGFEDCWILNNILDSTEDNIEKAIEEFTKKRKENVHAICDLAVYNYMEMRDLVTKRSYRLRKKFDEILFKIFPDLWVPLYNSVTFTHMGYADCVRNRQWQDKVLKRSLMAIVGSLVLSGAIYVYRR